MLKRCAVLFAIVFGFVAGGNPAAFGWCQACGGCPPGVSACADALSDNLSCAPPCANSSMNVNANCADWNCPATEVGQCNDGLNNDAWVDDLTDAEDPDCQAVTTPAPVPAMSAAGVTALVLFLIGVAVYRLRRRAAA
jgi:hypothetical protein